MDPLLSKLALGPCGVSFHRSTGRVGSHGLPVEARLKFPHPHAIASAISAFALSDDSKFRSEGFEMKKHSTRHAGRRGRTTR